MVTVTEADIGRTVVHVDPEDNHRTGATVQAILIDGRVIIQKHIIASDGPEAVAPTELEWPRQVIIEEIAPGNFTLREGARWMDSLNFDEMLGSVIALTHPRLPDRPVPYGGLRSAEEHEAVRIRRATRIQQRNENQ